MFRKGKTRRHTLTAAMPLAGALPALSCLLTGTNLRDTSRWLFLWWECFSRFHSYRTPPREKIPLLPLMASSCLSKTKSRKKSLCKGRERKGKTALRSPKITNDIPPPGLYADTETLIITIVFSGSWETGRSKTEDAEV